MTTTNLAGDDRPTGPAARTPQRASRGKRRDLATADPRPPLPPAARAQHAAKAGSATQRTLIEVRAAGTRAAGRRGRSRISRGNTPPPRHAAGAGRPAAAAGRQ